MVWPLESFKRLYQTVGYIVVSGDPDECFFDYRFPKEKSRNLYSYQKKIIPSTFSGTFFKRFKICYESNALLPDRSNVYFFLPSTTNCIKKIYRYLGKNF